MAGFVRLRLQHSAGIQRFTAVNPLAD